MLDIPPSATPSNIAYIGTVYGAKCFLKIVINATINKYCYISVRPLPPFFNYKYYIRYHKNELVSSISKIEHPSVRECLNYIL